MRKTQRSLRIDDKLYAQVKKLAKAANMTVSDLLDQALRHAVGAWRERIVIELEKKAGAK